MAKTRPGRRSGSGGRPAKAGQATKQSVASPTVAPELFFLDVGNEKYGDCIVIRMGDATVLVDGGHPSDFEGQDGYASIPDQLQGILGAPAPFDLTLVVVTHAHNDHIGCLPRMVEAGVIRPRFALVADPDLGFPTVVPEGREGASIPMSDAARAVLRTVAGMREEDQSQLDDAELRLFLDGVLKLGDRYRMMLRTLAERGCSIFRWGRDDPKDLLPIYEALPLGSFDVVGPTQKHLEICRDKIAGQGRDLVARFDDLLSARHDLSASDPLLSVDLYRYAVSSVRPDGANFADGYSLGAALNCQSIVMVFGPVGNRALLAGDMQFAQPDVPGLSALMAELRQRVAAAGPYRLAKTAHHTSHNGQDEALWTELGHPPLIVHSGGSADPAHPEASVLVNLSKWAPKVFARTDRNGQIGINLGRDDASAVTLARGTPNNFDANLAPPKRRDRQSFTAVPVQGQAIPPAQTFAAAAPAAALPLQRTPAGPPPPPPRATSPSRWDSCVDIVILRVPYEDSRIEVDGHSIVIQRGLDRGQTVVPNARLNDAPVPAGPAARLGSGRDLSDVLFVTNRALLERNVQPNAAVLALGMIREGGASIVFTDGIDDPHAAVRNVLGRGGKRGVVIVGGYDVVPSQRVDVLEPTLRASIDPFAIKDDVDEFVIWSDDVWGDADGQGLANVPVSRIPDGRSAELLLRALQASNVRRPDRFGIRNVARPFATTIYGAIPGQEGLLSSAPTLATQVATGDMTRSHIYLMLHGMDTNGTKFWGDDPANRTVLVAVDIDRMPRDGVGVVFAGCCWGALTVEERANVATNVLTPRRPDSSIALSFLAAGALAFVGSTGIHYSPDASGSFFGGPMHAAFWNELVTHGREPSEALFEARKSFLAEMPHGRKKPLEIGIERKIYRQFTCLGLGW